MAVDGALIHHQHLHDCVGWLSLTCQHLCGAHACGWCTHTCGWCTDSNTNTFITCTFTCSQGSPAMQRYTGSQPDLN
eukprot:1158220-Pelagomonas_calceolata.AAC.5